MVLATVGRNGVTANGVRVGVVSRVGVGVMVAARATVEVGVAVVMLATCVEGTGVIPFARAHADVVSKTKKADTNKKVESKRLSAKKWVTVLSWE